MTRFVVRRTRRDDPLYERVGFGASSLLQLDLDGVPSAASGA